MNFPLIFHKNGVEKILIHFATAYLLFKRGRIIPFPHKTIKSIYCKIIVGSLDILTSQSFEDKSRCVSTYRTPGDYIVKNKYHLSISSESR